MYINNHHMSSNSSCARLPVWPASTATQRKRLLWPPWAAQQRCRCSGARVEVRRSWDRGKKGGRKRLGENVWNHGENIKFVWERWMENGSWSDLNLWKHREPWETLYFFEAFKAGGDGKWVYPSTCWNLGSDTWQNLAIVAGGLTLYIYIYYMYIYPHYAHYITF